MKDEKICGVILAGGKSLRMGRNKALLEIEGEPLITRLVNLLSPLTDEIIISSNERAPYEALGIPVIADQFKDQGPLAGLHAAMVFTRRPLALVLACDLPRVHGPLLRRLLSLSSGFDAVVPRSTDGMAHPLCALYNRSCFSSIESNLKRNQNGFSPLLQDSSLKVRWVLPDGKSFCDDDLINLNSASDLEVYRSLRSQPLSFRKL